MGIIKKTLRAGLELLHPPLAAVTACTEAARRCALTRPRRFWEGCAPALNGGLTAMLTATSTYVADAVGVGGAGGLRWVL
jgi:hypothetical protein